MSRVQELTLKLMDGGLSNQEESELQRLLQNAAAQQEHIGMLELEAALRAEKQMDVSEQVVERLAKLESGETQKNVLDRIKARSSPSWKRVKASGVLKPVTQVSGRTNKSIRRARQAPSAFSPWMLAAATIAVIIGVVALVSKSSPPANTPAETIAFLKEAPAGTTILRDGKNVEAANGAPIYAGDIIAANTSALVSYSDGTEITLEPGCRLEFSAPNNQAGKLISLNAGTLGATVAKQNPERPLVIRTAHATATVLGTHFTLATTPDSSRLMVNEGRVRFERQSDGKNVTVNTGEFAVAAAGIDLIAQRIAEPAKIVQAPDVLPQVKTDPNEVAVSGFHLVNAVNGNEIAGFSPITDGMTIDLKKLPKISIIVKTQPEIVGSIVFDMDGKKRTRIEASPPYALTTNWEGGHYLPWAPSAGTHTITATPYKTKDGTGKAGRGMTIKVLIAH